LTLPSYLIDTNVLLRFLLNDDPIHSAGSKRLINRAKRGEVILDIPLITISETIYVLRKSYSIGKEIAVPEILRVLQARGIRTSGAAWIRDALEEFLGQNMSFGDICIAAEARALKKPVATFDRGFDKLEGVTRFEPK